MGVGFIGCFLLDSFEKVRPSLVELIHGFGRNKFRIVAISSSVLSSIIVHEILLTNKDIVGEVVLSGLLRDFSQHANRSCHISTTAEMHLVLSEVQLTHFANGIDLVGVNVVQLEHVFVRLALHLESLTEAHGLGQWQRDPSHGHRRRSEFRLLFCVLSMHLFGVLALGLYQRFDFLKD